MTALTTRARLALAATSALLWLGACGSGYEIPGLDGGPADAAQPDTGPHPNGPCAPEGRGLCWSSLTLLWCEGNRFLPVDCYGPQGCQPSDGGLPGCGNGDLVCRGGIACDFRNAQPGQTCPEDWAGLAHCWPNDAGVAAAVQCRQGMMHLVQCAQPCREENGAVYCRAL